MNERLAQVEAAVAELREENRRLRLELEELRRQLDPAGEDLPAQVQRKVWRRWSIVLLLLSLVAVPVLLLTVWHTNPFWTTTISALNALVVYFVGPGAVKLLVEGAIRAVPAILLGQTTRIAMDRFRSRRSTR